jgi:hypothetical protein
LGWKAEIWKTCEIMYEGPTLKCSKNEMQRKPCLSVIRYHIDKLKLKPPCSREAFALGQSRRNDIAGGGMIRMKAVYTHEILGGSSPALEWKFVSNDCSKKAT